MKTGKRFGKVTLRGNDSDCVCEWTLYEDMSLAVSVLTANKFAMKRVLQVAADADLNRVAREVCTELLARP